MKDNEFLRADKIPMTKREVRSVILERLALRDAGCFIDVGAGTGSVAIEAALSFPDLQVVAIEKNVDALAIMQQNMRHLGATRIEQIEAEAPCALLGSADAIFVGGSGGNLTAIIDWAWLHLRDNGRLVMSFILHDNLHQALNHLKRYVADGHTTDLDCVEIHISTMAVLGRSFYFKPNNPTYVMSCVKRS